MTLQGRTAVVTGGAGGIGRATSVQLARDGAVIAIWDIDVAGAQETVDLIVEEGGRAIACDVDVSSSERIADALSITRNELGPVTILINNAAMTGSSKFEDLSEDLWDRMIEIDLKGPFLCIKAVLPDMVAAGWGRIVNITSSSVYLGNPYMAHYVAAKGGLVGLTKALAMEFATRGITVNHVPPGYIDTPTLRRVQSNYAGSATSIEQTVQSFPMKRAGKPEDIAAACSYLASEQAGYVTGQTLSVNGGRYLL